MILIAALIYIALITNEAEYFFPNCVKHLGHPKSYSILHWDLDYVKPNSGTMSHIQEGTFLTSLGDKR